MIERKVLVPSAVALVSAVLALLVAFGVDLTQDQQTALLGLVVAILPVAQFVLGYLSPHTARPDLGAHEVAHDGNAVGDHGAVDVFTVAIAALVLSVVAIVLVLVKVYPGA